MPSHIKSSKNEICFCPSSIERIVANECPKFSATEVGLPITQMIMMFAVGIVLQDSSKALQIFAVTVITVSILAIVWVKRRNLIVVRMKEKDYNKMRASNLTTSFIDVRERHSFFPFRSNIDYRSNRPNLPTNQGADAGPQPLAYPLPIYAKICIAISLIIMTLGRIKSKHPMRTDVSAARELADEWEYELEQERSPWVQALNATLTVSDAAGFSIRHGVVGRSISRIRKSLKLPYTKCACDKPKSDCVLQNSDAANANTDEKDVIRKKF